MILTRSKEPPQSGEPSHGQHSQESVRTRPGALSRRRALAGRYRGTGCRLRDRAEVRPDLGIEKDLDVVFAESFEAASISSVVGNWEEAQWPENMALASDVPPMSGGKNSLHADGVAALYRRLLPGYDELYFRFYVKIDPTCTDSPALAIGWADAAQAFGISVPAKRA